MAVRGSLFDFAVLNLIYIHSHVLGAEHLAAWHRLCGDLHVKAPSSAVCIWIWVITNRVNDLMNIAKNLNLSVAYQTEYHTREAT